MSHKHSEIEYKFEAAHVNLGKFKELMSTQGDMQQHRHILSPDQYYELNGIAVRHRVSSIDGKGELTVKRRKSETSIVDRFEIDLTFSDDVSNTDVTQFLKLSGWNHVLTVWKEADVFIFNDGLSVVYYRCWSTFPKWSCVDNDKVFIEIEVGKNTDVANIHDMSQLNTTAEYLKKHLELGDPTDLSLYEIFSGKRYLVYNDDKGEI